MAATLPVPVQTVNAMHASASQFRLLPPISSGASDYACSALFPHACKQVTRLKTDKAIFFEARDLSALDLTQPWCMLQGRQGRLRGRRGITKLLNSELDSECLLRSDWLLDFQYCRKYWVPRVRKEKCTLEARSFTPSAIAEVSVQYRLRCIAAVYLAVIYTSSRCLHWLSRHFCCRIEAKQYGGPRAARLVLSR